MSDRYIDGMPNHEYHRRENGCSTSVIKNIVDDPALVKWGERASQDKSKLAAIDFGTDFHLYFLESEEFERTYKVLPVFNRRKAAEKQEELDLIKQWRSEGIVPVTSEDFEKCKAMRESALAHPTVAAMMALNGIAERSYFWTNKKTGVECKCRPDWLVLDINDGNRPRFMPPKCTTLVMDVKTIARMDKVQSQIEELKYYIQDAHYTEGVSQVTGTDVCFVFAFVSTTLSLGRYPVRVIALSDAAKAEGRQDADEALDAYARIMSEEDDAAWETLQILDRPSWATREEAIF